MEFEQAYLGAQPSVVASAWAVCRDRSLAEECAQEAFARAYARWLVLRSSDHAIAWIHRVAINLAIDEVRRRARQGVTRPEQASDPVASDDTIDLVRQLARLPRRQREAIVLLILADMSEADTARAMGISAGSVKVHKRRGLDRLRQLVANPRQEASRG